jgi:hypothetical protein
MLQLAKNSSTQVMSDEYLKKGERIVKDEINDIKKLSIISKRRLNLK